MLSDQGQRLPQFQIGAARRSGAVLDKAHFAVRKRARAMRRRQQRVRVEQCPGAERRSRRRFSENQRFGRYRRQPFLDQHRAAVVARRIGCPVALDRAQPPRRVPNRGNRDRYRVEPDILRPRRRKRRARRRAAAGHAQFDFAQFVRQLGDKSFRREIRRPGCRRAGFGTMLRQCASSPERRHDPAAAQPLRARRRSADLPHPERDVAGVGRAWRDRPGARDRRDVRLS